MSALDITHNNLHENSSHLLVQVGSPDEACRRGGMLRTGSGVRVRDEGVRKSLSIPAFCDELCLEDSMLS